jgi:hypothetical protein
MSLKSKIHHPLFILLIITSGVVIFTLINIPSYPLLFPGNYIKDKRGDIDIGSYSVPVFYDWDGDSLKDLLVGYSTTGGKEAKGKIKFFKNKGTKQSPKFNTQLFIRACNDMCTLEVPASY